MTTQVATSLYNELGEAYALRENNPVWRDKAFAVFREKGFPTIKEEDWRFTNLAPFLNDASFIIDHSVAPRQELGAFLDAHTIPGLNAYRLVLVNGVIEKELSVLPAAAGVHSLQEKQQDEKIASILAGPHDRDSLIALNTAFFDNGYFIEIPAGTVLDKPIEIIHLYQASTNALFQPRHLVMVGQHAQVALIERTFMLGDEGITMNNAVTHVALKENASLTHYQLQSGNRGERTINHTLVAQQRDSHYRNFTCSLPGADLLRNQLNISLQGTATETDLYGLYIVGDDQLTDNHTAIHHIHPSCHSNEVYKGVMLGNGKAVFNGKILVESEAQKTNAYQQNKNLLLSDKALLHAKPQLEIFADDVKCSHGCTIGQFDPESLFYLRSRGISEAGARQLLINAFAFDVTDKIEQPALREYIQHLIAGKIGALN